MTTPHIHAEVIHAFAEGKEIQCKPPRSTEEWVADCDPRWFLDWQYRVKPEEPKPLWKVAESVGSRASTTVSVVDYWKAVIAAVIAEHERRKKVIGWAVVGKDEKANLAGGLREAPDYDTDAAWWDKHYRSFAPHRIVALVEKQEGA